MSAAPHVFQLDGIEIEALRKDVKHVRISVHPPDGRVRVSVPLHVRDSDLRQMLVARLPWILGKRAEVVAREPQERHEYVPGEQHLFRGERYLLQVTERARADVRLGDGIIEIHVPRGASREQREAVLERWYRARLAERAAALCAEWEPRLGVRAAEVRIRRMKTRWGSCNPRARRVWLNLELIKRHDACLEYVLVHELVHLLEASHGPRFKALMDGFMPRWRAYRQALKATP